MVKKNDNTILWAVGIIIFLIVATKLPLIPQFVIVSKTTCIYDTVSYWDLDGNVLDARGVYNGINNGVIFVGGKIGQGAEFNTTTYIDFPNPAGGAIGMWINNYSDVGSDWYFVVNSNGTNYINGVIDDSKQMIDIGSTFGLGFNGSIDEITIFNVALTESEILDLYPIPRSICETEAYEENLTCMEYATEQVVIIGDGCLSYSGDSWQECEFEWIQAPQYQIVENKCEAYFYCQENCTIELNCYVTEQVCLENLTYDCYVNEDNVCIQKTDYSSCVGENISYINLTECEESLATTTPTTTTPTGTIGIGDGDTTPSTTDEDETFMDKLNQEVFEIAGVSVKLIYLIILLIMILGAVYFITSYKK